MLKNETFTFNGVAVTLYELSALQRIEFIEYLVTEEKYLPSENEAEKEQHAAIIAFHIRESARVVAMSLWQADRKGPTVDDIQQEVLETWPVEAISTAAAKIKSLSGINPREATASAPSGESETTAEPQLTAEKPSPAS